MFQFDKGCGTCASVEIFGSSTNVLSSLNDPDLTRSILPMILMINIRQKKKSLFKFSISFQNVILY